MAQSAPIPETQLLTVCGGNMKEPSKFHSAVFDGKRVYFCTSACLAAFLSDPERFMSGEIEHPGEID